MIGLNLKNNLNINNKMATEQKEITLDLNNSVQFLVQFIEQANKNPSNPFSLAEADILKRSSDFLINNVHDIELTIPNARQNLISAIHKAQSRGCFTLHESSVLHKITQFITGKLTEEAPPKQIEPILQSQVVTKEDDDLSELSDPVPLRPRVV